MSRKIAGPGTAILLLFLAACQDVGDTLTGPVAQSNDATVSLSPTVHGQSIPGRYIVVFRDDVRDVPGLARQLSAQSGGSIGFTYEAALRGFSLHVAPASGDRVAEALRRNPNVAMVEADQVVHLDTLQTSATWGLDRIDQRLLPLNSSYRWGTTGAGVTAYVIDSGIRFDHTDFGGRAALGVDYINDDMNGGDCNGHGTHVAGTIGGQTWGVAKSVNLVSVRVFACTGGSSWETVIKAIDWVTANGVKPAVVNMSLGGGYYSPGNQAVTNSIAAGFVYSISAGNNNADACNNSPASTPNAITVGSTTSTDARSSFSNYGSCLDIFAPGSSITSAWHTGTTDTNRISGTSMAAPHVAGVAALLLQTMPGATPLAIRDSLFKAGTPDVVTNSLTSGARLIFSRVATASGTLPSVTTAAASSVTTSSATTGGNVTNAGSAAVTSRGVCYGTSTNPSSNCVESGSGTGSFSINLTDLAHSTTYYVRAFATSSVGTAYGNQTSFATASPPDLAAPVITTFNVTNASGGRWTRADVAWTVTDDLALQQVRVELLDGTNSVASQTTSVSGTSASGSTSLRTRGAAQSVRLTVTDASGKTTEQTKSIDGDDPPPPPEDDPPPPPEDDPPPPPGEDPAIQLTGNGYKVKGAWAADLSWAGATSVVIQRNGSVIATVSNSSSYTDQTRNKGGGTLTYVVCEAGTSTCSNPLTLTY